MVVAYHPGPVDADITALLNTSNATYSPPRLYTASASINYNARRAYEAPSFVRADVGVLIQKET